MKRTPLKRSSSSLRCAKAPQRRRKAKRVGLSPETAACVYARQKGLCCCGCGGRIAPFPMGYHHIWPKAKWPSLIDVSANIAGVGADCHASHETAARRLPRASIAFAEVLAATHEMRSYLDRTYGPREE